jgi:hypothetical protein
MIGVFAIVIERRLHDVSQHGRRDDHSTKLAATKIGVTDATLALG